VAATLLARATEALAAARIVLRQTTRVVRDTGQ
jgi:hypothetical protein